MLGWMGGFTMKNRIWTEDIRNGFGVLYLREDGKKFYMLLRLCAKTLNNVII